jgi:geranylgeranyl diphosphate synthase type II
MFSGGKRTRPILTLLGVQACGGDLQKAVPAACAIECLHCASLIFDDMPCMDNAPERRGVASAHVIFGEGMAVLAALALLNRAYSLFGQQRALSMEACACVTEIIEGQAIDLQGRRERLNRKTRGLMRLSLTAGAIACGASDADIDALARCGEYVGEAYQMYDDFEDGDSTSKSGADELVAAAKGILDDRFAARGFPLVKAIDAIVIQFNDRKLVAA